MQKQGPRRPLDAENGDQTEQKVQNGVVINRVSPKKRVKSRPDQNVRNEIPGQEDNMSSNPNEKLSIKKKKLTKKQLIKRIGIGITAFLVVLAIAAGLIWNYIFSGLETQTPEGTIYPTEALTYQPPEDKDITNILLLGVDSRNPKVDKGLSDSIIILTVDNKNNVLKMTSIMRDCLVYIPGYKNPEKINAAHNFGGPELALRTINNTLRLNIQKYIVVNMYSMANIIDIADGVTITLTEAERIEINTNMGLTNPIKASGTVKLTGEQAVLYSRIRHIDNDAERTRRQRNVLTALYLGFKNVNAISKAQMIQKGLSEIVTNMTATEITSLGLNVLPKMANEIQQLKLPIDGYYTVVSTGVWYMNVDYNGMIPKVYEFIYGETQPFDPVPTIDNKSAPSLPSSSKSSSASVSKLPTPTLTVSSASSSTIKSASASTPASASVSSAKSTPTPTSVPASAST